MFLYTAKYRFKEASFPIFVYTSKESRISFKVRWHGKNAIPFYTLKLKIQNDLLQTTNFLNEKRNFHETPMRMKMKEKIGLKVLAISIALVIVASSMAMYGYSGTEVEKGVSEGGGKGVISLVPPSFISTAKAAGGAGGGVSAGTTPTTFPVDDAGIVAYVRVGSSVDLDKTYAAYKDVVDTSATHIIGTVRIPNLIGDSVPLVYVGADGWVIAYYPEAEPASRIMQWINYSAPYINTTTLADAISKMATALGVDYESIKGDIKYYDFRYPEATLMTMIVETASCSGFGFPSSANSFNLTIPETITLYHASYSHYYSVSGSCSVVLDVDGTVISSYKGPSSNGVTYGYYNITRDFEKDVPHKVKISVSTYAHAFGYTIINSGASTVLIYRN